MTVTKRRLARLLVVVAGLSLVYLAHGGLIYFLAFAALAGTLAHPSRGERSRWSYRLQDSPGPVTNPGRRSAAHGSVTGGGTSAPVAPSRMPPIAPLETGQILTWAQIRAATGTPCGVRPGPPAPPATPANARSGSGTVATYTANPICSVRSASPDVAVNSDKLLSCA